MVHVHVGVDLTAIMEHPRCHVEEISFQKAMSHGELQPTLIERLAYVADIERKAVTLFRQSPRAFCVSSLSDNTKRKKVIGLAFSE